MPIEPEMRSWMHPTNDSAAGGASNPVSAWTRPARYSYPGYTSVARKCPGPNTSMSISAVRPPRRYRAAPHDCVGEASDTNDPLAVQPILSFADEQSAVGSGAGRGEAVQDRDVQGHRLEPSHQHER